MTSVPVAAAPMRPILPSSGVARVKNVLSGDTVVLVGSASSPNAKPPEVVFTLERVSAPRIASKANNNVDEPGAFPAREWLRTKLVGKSVTFETRKQGATAGDRVYGLLLWTDPDTGKQVNLAVESVRCGHAIPKLFDAPKKDEKDEDEPEEAVVQDEYESQLRQALAQAQQEQAGVHGSSSNLVRKLQNAGTDFETLQLVQSSQQLCADKKVKCVIEYIFDGSRLRCHVTDDQLAAAGLQHASFTLLLAGVTSPRCGNPRATPPTTGEPLSEEARSFVELRLLQRELNISLHGTDKSGTCAVGTVHHPRGSIAVELLKNGLARMSDWSVRMMNPMDVPALRIAENQAKRTNTGVWHSYAPPQLSGASEFSGTVVEVVTGDTFSLLPSGEEYDSESKLKKISLASIRAPRVGNERMGRPDEPYCHECKDRLRVLVVGKPVKVSIHYERDIPFGENTEKRQFGTVAVGKRPDISETLISEGLAVTQRHRDDDEKSPRYDELRAAEAVAKAAKKGVHSEQEYKKGAVNDLTVPQKAKAYSGSLMRAGTLKAVVEYAFNGSRFKLLVPSENCHIIFAPTYLRCPQPSPNPGSRATRPAEPFGDASKRHARLTVLQRSVEIICTGVTNGGVITGDLFVGQGGQRRDYSLELVAAGLAHVDQRKIDWGEAPKVLVDAQAAAQNNKVGIWSVDRPVDEKKVVKAVVKSKEETISVRLSEIRTGSHFFYHKVGDEAVQAMDESMKLFTKEKGTQGAPSDVKVGRVLAALFDDGTGKSWYRAKVVERRGPGKVQVVFIDHGNAAVVPVATHLRPLDLTLGTDRIPPVATEAQLALTLTRGLEDDEGLDAARMLQSLAWGKDLSARLHAVVEGKMVITLLVPGEDKSINEQLVAAGSALAAKQAAVDELTSRMLMDDNNTVVSLAADLQVAQETARKSRCGMWRYGDVGDDDEDM